ncbi:TBC1 domain family member 23 [Echinococcus granulosus]|uniref:TBC1 domain family member 23 n=1 Tax=Echinococcus granulosus TaxID=6210 RepID=A0A068WFX2_ECHGR|nr:TBC1 domain family member 23 [Echinococcus granulosus]CDS19007.1 Rhodanese [Echinococcus granulosus]
MASGASDSSLDDTSIDDAWETELEIALLKDADFADIKSICQIRPVPARLRRDLWRSCLGVNPSLIGMSNFAEIFDLPTQEQLHMACENAASDVIASLSRTMSSDLGILKDPPNVLQLTSDFESVLTHFSQTYTLPFIPGNGWVSILSTLYIVLYPIDREDLYVYFTSVYHRFIPSGTQGSSHACSVFRLLLQYHEPELCNFLDSHKLPPEVYAKAWFDSLFADHLSNEALPAFWDIYFLLGEPLFGMLVALVLLVNAKDILMQKEKEIGQEAVEETLSLNDNEDVEMDEQGTVTIPPKSRDEILVELRNLPKPMRPSDLVALVEITQVYSLKTPSSFNTTYLPFLFGAPSPETDSHLLSGALSLLISVEEVLGAQTPCRRRQSPPHLETGMGIEAEEGEGGEAVRFFLVDCRPAEQYNAGHLDTAFYLDTELMLSNPPEFNISVQALLQTQQRGIASRSRAVGEHIVFMGSGRLAEDRLTNMVIAYFLRLNTPYVSMVDGGYAAFHEALGPLEFNRLLVSHEEDLCFVCAANRGQQAIRMAHKMPPSAVPAASKFSSNSLSSKTPHVASTFQPAQSFGNVLTKFSNLLKKSPVGAFRTPQIVPSAASVPAIKPASYRNTAAVFSIGDDDDEDDDDEIPEFSLQTHPHALIKSQSTVVTSLEVCTPRQLIDLEGCRRMPGVTNSFDCVLLGRGETPSYRGIILVTEKHMIVVRERDKPLLETLGNFVQKTFLRKATASSKAASSAETERSVNGVVEVSFPIGQLTKITSKKITPEVITFHCISDPVLGTREFIRLYIPKAGDAVKVIKTAVFNNSRIS